MHEMAIAVELMRQLETLAQERAISCIEELTVTAGQMRQIVPEALKLAFELSAEGTVAAGAKLNVQVVPAVARCRQCGQKFEPAAAWFLCPTCQQADVEMVEGNDIILTSVRCQIQEGAPCRGED